ncbi:MAG TPA: collagen-like protein [Conexibacter sp.]|jgi:hypothetical protein
MPNRLWDHVRRQPIALLALFVALGGTSYAAAGGGAKRSGVETQRMYACVTAEHRTLNLTTAGGRCPSGQRKVSWQIQSGADLGGRRGPAGRRGARGEAGAPGARGENGAPGARGENGPAGARGENGPGGAPGEAGPAGERGETGATGATGTAGATGPQGTAGEVDQTTLDAIDTRLDALEVGHANLQARADDQDQAIETTIDGLTSLTLAHQDLTQRVEALEALL